jgi:hypothetical protein
VLVGLFVDICRLVRSVACPTGPLGSREDIIRYWRK